MSWLILQKLPQRSTDDILNLQNVMGIVFCVIRAIYAPFRQQNISIYVGHCKLQFECFRVNIAGCFLFTV